MQTVTVDARIAPHNDFEADYDWLCSCEKDEEGVLRWACIKGPICTN